MRSRVDWTLSCVALIITFLSDLLSSHPVLLFIYINSCSIMFYIIIVFCPVKWRSSDCVQSTLVFFAWVYHSYISYVLQYYTSISLFLLINFFVIAMIYFSWHDRSLMQLLSPLILAMVSSTSSAHVNTFELGATRAMIRAFIFFSAHNMLGEMSCRTFKIGWILFVHEVMWLSLPIMVYLLFHVKQQQSEKSGIMTIEALDRLPTFA